MLATMRRLHARGRASRGVAVDVDGAMLGPDCVLVRRTPTGYRSIGPHEAAAIQKTVLGPQCETGWLFDQARRIADALANGELALAQIYGLRIPIADLDDAGLQRLAAASRLVKANFDPSQPRVPAGNPDGGQWLDTGGSDDTDTDDGADWVGGGDDEGWPAEAGDDDFDIDDDFDAEDYDPDDGFEGPSRKKPPPLGDGGDEPPRIPSKPPETTKDINRLARDAAEWLARATAKGLTEATLTYWEVLKITAWLAGKLPAILSYQDEPKTLEELQDAVTRRPHPGYDVHHAVERQRWSLHPLSNWKRFGNRLDTRENLVLIPYWKHVQISSWYSTRNDAFGGLRPREYLRGKSWDEQYQVGLDALRLFGVLK